MKCQRKPITLLLLVSFLMLFWSSLLLLTPAKNNSHNLQIMAESPLYMRSDTPLDIDGNTQLAAAASSGNGQPGTSYIIENKSINANGLGTDGVRIQNTTAYSILQNCNIMNADTSFARNKNN